MVAALFCVLLGSIDLTVVASILPGMIADLGVNTADIDRYIWAVNGYLIAYIVAIPLIGRLSDLIGRQRTFIASLLIFLAGSIMCALANDLTDLVIGRAIQGFGGGGLLPVAIALAGDTLGRKGQLAGIGFVSAMETIGWILGPIYGAAVTEIVGFTAEPWRWVFWLNVPVLAVLIVVLRGMAKSSARPPGNVIRLLDLPGTVLLVIALVCLNLALASGGEIGASTGTGLRAMGGTANPLADQVPWLLAAAGIAMVLLILTELRTTHPILPVRLYRQRPFLATILVNLCIGAVLMVTMVNIPVVVALTADPGDSSTLSALLLAPFTVAIATASLLASRLTHVIGEKWTLGGGIVLSAAGCVLVSILQEQGNFWSLVPGLLVSGAGLGLLLPALGTLPIQLASVSERGAAASSALMFRLLGMTVGVSTLTALGVRRLQVLTGRVEPIVREPDESTASFLLRQREFIIDHAIPLSLQVVEETFLVAALIAIVAALPLAALARFMAGKGEEQPETLNEPG
jgi:MFS family permease